MKRIFIATIIMLCAVMGILSAGTQVAFAEETIYRTYFDGTPVFAEASDISAVVALLDGGTNVEVKDTINTETGAYSLISCNSIQGYVKSDAIYEVRDSAKYKIAFIRATRTAEDENIVIFSAPRTDSKVVTKVSDGVVLEMVSMYNDDFYYIHVADGECGYIPSANVTTGLSYYQKIAVIVICVVVVAVLSIVLIQSLGKKKTTRNTASFE